MKDDKKVPQLRFPEFTDAWKQRKLSCYLDVSSEKNIDNHFSKVDVLSVSGDYGVVNQIEFQGRSFAGVSVSNYGVAHTGNVIYTKSPLKATPFGIIKTNKGTAGIVSTLYAVYYVKENSYPNFIQDYFELNSRLNNYLRPLVNKGSKNDMKVSNENALKGLVIFPNLEEQRKISSFFAQLNNAITLQQRKLNSLQKLKKGLLQKMFPKNGENIPEIRFPEFSDAWKQRKLGEIIDYSNGIGHENYVLPQGKYELVTLKSINSSGKLVCSEKFVNEDFETLKAETLIMMLSEQAKGMLGMTTIIPCDNKYVLNQRVAALKAHNDVEVNFLTNAINNKQNYFEQMGAGTKVQNITRGHVEECVIELPSLEEQKKIGSLFSKLEVTITLQQRKLESLQKLKKGLLQQMFI